MAHKHRLLIYAKPGIHFDRTGVPHEGEGHCGEGTTAETYAIHRFSVSFLPIQFFPKTQFPPDVSHVASDQHMQPPFMKTQSAGAFMLRGGSAFTQYIHRQGLWDSLPLVVAWQKRHKIHASK